MPAIRQMKDRDKLIREMSRLLNQFPNTSVALGKISVKLPESG